MARPTPINGPADADGTVTHLWDCHSGTSQKWTPDGSRRLVNPYSGKCLDVTDGGSADGARLQIWTCGADANQKWTVNH